MKNTTGRRFRPLVEQFEDRSVPAFLTPIGSPVGGYSPSVADFNHDGRVDVAVIIPGNKNVGVSLNKGDGTFRQPITLTGAKGDGLYSANASDVNGDGHPDVVALGTPKNFTVKYDSATGYGAEGNVYENVWLGNGDGKFGHVSVTSHYVRTTAVVAYGEGYWIWPPLHSFDPSATADFNHDGIDDLANRYGNNGVIVSLRNGDGTTQASQIYPIDLYYGVQWIRAGDFNGDGWTDLVVSNGSALLVLLNDATW